MTKQSAPSAFTQGNVTRVLRAARAAGVDIARIEVDPSTGKIIITTPTAASADDPTTAFDRWMGTHEVRLKGINSKTKVLADGRKVTYYWAWKGGPRLEGAYGSPEFMASYLEACSKKTKAPSGALQSVLNEFQQSQEFLGLAERTREDYVDKIKLIEKKLGSFPLAALADQRTVGVFKKWRDQLAIASLRQADYTWSVLARVLSWALGRGLTVANPCAKGGRLYHGTRADKIWTDDDEALFIAKAPMHLHLPLMLALWTGQRQGDLLRLPWSAYDGTSIRLRQSKTGARVKIPAGAPLKAMLDATPRVGPLVLTSTDEKPWTADGFRSSWRKAQAAAGIVGVTFNDLRGTAVTRLALAEATEAEIATITGHSLRDVRSILDAHYLHRDPALGQAAIRKLETRTKVSRPDARLVQDGLAPTVRKSS